MTLIEEAQALLLHQYQQSPKLKALLGALVKPFAEADEKLHNLHHGHYIDDASGNALDIIGSIVGQPRLNMTDDDYRPWIKVAILLNNSAGTAETVLHILAILFGKKPPIRMEEYAPNDVQFTFFEYPKFSITTLFAIMRTALPINTKAQFIRADLAAAFSSLDMTNSTSPLPAFRLDFTPFSACYFAEFFEGEF